jgi:hypothetical protein
VKRLTITSLPCGSAIHRKGGHDVSTACGGPAKRLRLRLPSDY